MKKNNQALQVLEPEVEEIPLEEVINNTLVKANVTDNIITSLKERFGDMRLKDIEDKETYLEIKEARKEVRKIGILTEKLCKKGREDAVAIQRKWLAKEKEILGKIAEVEIPLNNEIEKFENEVERKELEESKRQENIYMNRQAILLKYGAQYNNGSFELNYISYEVELIKQADDEQWNDTILPKYRKVYEETEAAKVAEENRRKEEIEKQRQEREAFELQQKKFKEEQELFAKQQSELQKQKDEYERRQRMEQESKEAEERKKADGIRYLEEGKKREEAAILRALEEQKIKQQQEQQRKEEELAQANDKTRFLEIIAQFQEIKIHEMKSPLYKRKVQMIREKLGEIYSL